MKKKISERRQKQIIGEIIKKKRKQVYNNQETCEGLGRLDNVHNVHEQVRENKIGITIKRRGWEGVDNVHEQVRENDRTTNDVSQRRKETEDHQVKEEEYTRPEELGQER